VPLVFLTNAYPHWWVLPIGGVIIGYVTNWVALWMIFEPVNPRRLGPFKLHGLFIRRQPEVSGVYGEIIAEDIVTLGNIGEELLHGPSADRTRQMIEDSMRPAVDRATGPARLAVKVALGTDQYETIRESVATEAVEGGAHRARFVLDGFFDQSASFEIVIRDGETAVDLIVRDDGSGFDPNALARSAARGRLGLIGMRERIALLGGSISIDSRPGAGTTVAVGIPRNGGEGP